MKIARLHGQIEFVMFEISRISGTIQHRFVIGRISNREGIKMNSLLVEGNFFLVNSEITAQHGKIEAGLVEIDIAVYLGLVSCTGYRQLTTHRTRRIRNRFIAGPLKRMQLYLPD